MSTILCLSTNICIFPFPPVLLFTPIKTTTTSFILKSRFVFILLIPKPCPASVWAGVVPYSLADWSLHTVTGRTSWSLAVQFSHTHTPSGKETSLQPQQQMLQPPDIVSVEKKAVCIYGYISAHLYIFDM